MKLHKTIFIIIILISATIVQANDINIIDSDANQLIVEFNFDNDSCVSSGLLVQVPSTGDFWVEVLKVDEQAKDLKLVELGVREILRDIPVSRLQIFPCQENFSISKIRLKIQFENSLPKSRIKSSSFDIYDKLLQSTIINYRGISKATIRNLSVETNHPALRIETTEAGIYRLYYQQAVNAGMPAAIIPENLQLFNQGNEVAVRIDLKQQFMEFYAEPSVYWLYWSKNSLGKRISSIDDTATETVIHIEENHIWGRHEFKGFWQRLNALDVKNYNIKLSTLPLANTEVKIKVAFYGYTTAAPHPNHHTLIYLNDNLIGDAYWNGRTEYIQEMLVPASIFTNETNILTIKLPGDTGAIVDSIFLDWIELHQKNSITNKINTPKNITLWQSPQLKSPNNGADYILITAKEFLPAVEPLSNLRRQQGLRVKTVSVEDIYNEFNYGLSDSAAIKEFLAYAYENWAKPAPTYVFLVGDAKINLEDSKVPTHFYTSAENIIIPDDNWYVNVAGNDNLPDMFIGRIPGNSSKMVSQIINKIIDFENSTNEAPNKVLLVADNETQFHDFNERLFKILPAEYEADKVYLEPNADASQANQEIIASINNGVMISNYIGHGTIDKWSIDKGLFKSSDIEKLNNEQQLIFALMLTCINGYFVSSYAYSLAEEMIIAKTGAIGVFAASNLTYLWENAILANYIFDSVFKQGNRRLGLITTQAKIKAYELGASAEVLRMFTFFGDPYIKLPQ